MDTTSLRNRLETMCDNALRAANRGAKHRAEMILQEAVDLVSKEADDKANDAYALYLVIGDAYAAMEDATAALKAYRYAADIVVTEGDEDPRYAECSLRQALLLGKLGQTSTSERLLREALSIHVRRSGLEHPACASVLTSLGTLLCVTRRFDEARAAFETALNIRRSLSGDGDPLTSRSFVNLGEMFLSIGDTVQAESCYRQMCNGVRRARGEADPTCWAALQKLGEFFQRVGSPREAAKLYREILMNRFEVGRCDDLDTANILDALASIYSQSGAVKPAQRIYEQAMSVVEAREGRKHPAYAISLRNLGLLFESIGDFKAAHDRYSEVLTLRREIFGAQHPSCDRVREDLRRLEQLGKQTAPQRRKRPPHVVVAEHEDCARTGFSVRDLFGTPLQLSPSTQQLSELSLPKPDNVPSLLPSDSPLAMAQFHAVAVKQRDDGDFDAAETTYSHALEWFRVHGSETDSDIVPVLNSFGVLLLKIGKCERAGDVLEDAVSRAKHAGADKERGFGAILYNLAHAYMQTAREDRAKQVLLEMLAWVQIHTGKGDDDYRDAIEGLAKIETTFQDFAAARQYFRLSLWFRTINEEDDYPGRCLVLQRLARVELELKNVECATSLARERVDITSRHFGAATTEFIDALEELAKIHERGGDLEGYETVLREAINLHARNPPLNRRQQGRIITRLALLKGSLGEYDEAQRLFVLALDTCRSAVGEKHRDYAICLLNLAEFYRDTSSYNDSIVLGRRALDCIRNTENEKGDDVAMIMTFLANIYLEAGIEKEARSLCNSADNLFRNAREYKSTNYARLLNLLGQLHQFDRNVSEAEACFRRAMDILSNDSTVPKERYAKHAYNICLCNLALFLLDVGQLAEARRIVDDIEPHVNARLDFSNNDLAHFILLRGDLESAEGKLDLAEASYRQCVDIRTRLLGDAGHSRDTALEVHWGHQPSRLRRPFAPPPGDGIQARHPRSRRTGSLSSTDAHWFVPAESCVASTRRG
jgi:tetratricopeptide (TPR) repeat protein